MATAVTPEPVEKVVIEALRSSAPTSRQITREATFEELDVDSLDLAELVADHRGRVRRPAQGRRRRKIKTVGDAIDLVVSRAAMKRERRRHRRRRRHPAGVGADRSTSAGPRGNCGIEDGEGACREFDPTEHLSDQGGAPRGPLHAVRDGRLRRGAARRRLGRTSCPTTPSAIGCIIGTGIGGIGTLEASTTCCCEKGPKTVSPLAIPLMMGNAGAGALSHAPRPARASRIASSRPARPASHAIGAAVADDPVRRRRRGRHRRLARRR